MSKKWEGFPIHIMFDFYKVYNIILIIVFTRV